MTEEKGGFWRSDQFYKCPWRRELEWGGDRGKNATGENGGREWKGKKRSPHGVNANGSETTGEKEKVPRETSWDFSGAKKKVLQKKTILRSCVAKTGNTGKRIGWNWPRWNGKGITSHTLRESASITKQQLDVLKNKRPLRKSTSIKGQWQAKAQR